MKKKLLTFVLSTALVMSALSGCGSSTQEEGASASGNSVNEEEQPQEEGKLESGTVTLTVWAEENNFEMLNKMIESFKEKYAGQADFDITLVAQSDATVKDVMLGDVHAAADVFSFPDDQLTSLIAAGALEPVPNAAEISSANLADAVEASSYKGTLYAYPMTADNGYFMYYDKDYFTDEDI